MKVKYKPQGRGRRPSLLLVDSEYELLLEFTDYNGEHYVALLVATGTGGVVEATVLAENVEFPEDPPPPELQPTAATGVAGTLKQRKHTHGDPNHADNWHDIAGYETLAEHEL